MTRQEMQKALETGFNKQGRHLSESMRIQYLSALQKPQKHWSETDYRGFKIEGRNGRYFCNDLPHMIFTSVPNAHKAVDRCLEVRALMAEEV